MDHDVVDNAVGRGVEDDDSVAQLGDEGVVNADVVPDSEILHGVGGPAANHHTGFKPTHGGHLSARLTARAAGDRDPCPSGQPDASELAACPLVAVAQDPVAVQVEEDVVGADDDAIAGAGADVVAEHGVLGDYLPAGHLSCPGVPLARRSRGRRGRPLPCRQLRYVRSMLLTLPTLGPGGISLSRCGATRGSAQQQEAQGSTDADTAAKSSYDSLLFLPIPVPDPARVARHVRVEAREPEQASSFRHAAVAASCTYRPPQPSEILGCD